MIEPQELRLGNLVTIDNPDFHKKMKGIPVIVNGINFRIERDFPKSTASISVTDGKFSYDQFNEFISPIELTEEWLQKFGFEKNDDFWTIENIDIEDFKRNKDYVLIFNHKPLKSGFEGRICIFYVHQLQNLYFALKAKELTIK